MKKIFALAVLFAAVSMVSCGCFQKKAFFWKQPQDTIDTAANNTAKAKIFFITL